MKNKAELKDIKIRAETKRQLDELRHLGQSYDGVIRELEEMAKALQFELEKSKDDQERMDNEWQLTLKKYGDAKEFKKQEWQQELAASAERTKIMKAQSYVLGRIVNRMIRVKGNESKRANDKGKI